MLLNSADISEQIKTLIASMDDVSDVRNQGTVETVTDGICRVSGLSEAMQGEMLEFPPTPDGLPLMDWP